MSENIAVESVKDDKKHLITQISGEKLVQEILEMSINCSMSRKIPIQGQGGWHLSLTEVLRVWFLFKMWVFVTCTAHTLLKHVTESTLVACNYKKIINKVSLSKKGTPLDYRWWQSVCKLVIVFGDTSRVTVNNIMYNNYI